MNDFKPQLNPNNKAGVEIDWKSRLGNLNDWIWSEKMDGIRGVFDLNEVTVKSRSLKAIRSVEVQSWIWQLGVVEEGAPVIVEGEIWSPNLTLEEIKHFVMSEDVTSQKSIKKLKREFNTAKWKFPFRDVEFMSTFPKCLKLHVFDCYSETLTKEQRYHVYTSWCERVNHPKIVSAKQYKVTSLDRLTKRFNEITARGGEGIMLFKKESIYKCGRHTEREAMSFKMKDDNVKFFGMIIDVPEGTNVDPLAEVTTNELGRSVTSKKKEDRIPNGMAKGFLIRMEMGEELIVTFKNANNFLKSSILRNADDYIGMNVTFTGMKPRKFGGKPAQARIDMNTLNK